MIDWTGLAILLLRLSINQSLDFLNAHTLVGRKPHSDTESINFRYVVFLSHQACWIGNKIIWAASTSWQPYYVSML